MRWFFGAIVAIVLIAGGYFWYASRPAEIPAPAVPVKEEKPFKTREVIGQSVGKRAIEAFTYGTGPERLVFVGGIHGGYEWNSVLLAYQFMDHLEKNPATVPAGMSVTVIPSANPDGVFAIVGKEGRFALADVPEGDQSAGRFNANEVDLNRNFDCKWQPKGTWRSAPVSAGSAAFSEPESKALRDFLLKTQPAAAVFWHSQAGAVYGSECEDGVLPATWAAVQAYAKAAEYEAVKSFDAYPVVGDAEGWLASEGIPAFSVELTTHEDVEWQKNLAGIKATIQYFQQQ